jgi:hypothetical protein
VFEIFEFYGKNEVLLLLLVALQPFVVAPWPPFQFLELRSAELSCYDRWSVGLSILVSGTPLGPMTRFYICLSFAGKLICSSSWGALSDERTGL